jgi:TatD DNase family protein
MNNIFFTDSHAHIHMPPLDQTTADIVKRANEHNIHRILTIGIDVKDSANAIKATMKYDNVYAAVGVHPHNAAEFNIRELSAFEEMLTKPKVIAIGEVGLDFYRNNSPKERQIEVFSLMIDLAISAGKPIIIHSREAAADTISLLENIIGDQDQKILFHCFSGEKSLLEWGMARKNCLFSFAGNVTYPKAVELHSALAQIPVERLLIETDCPYLAPIPLRGRQNEPAYLPHTAKYVAEAKNLGLENLASRLEGNFREFFEV